MRLIPNIRYGTERYPERVARRLRAVNITAWFGASVLYLIGWAGLIDPTPVEDDEGKIILLNLLTASILLALPLLHRFSPLAAPIILLLIGYALIFANLFVVGIGLGADLYFLVLTALGILLIGPEYVWLTVTLSLVSVGLIIVLNMTVPHDKGIVSPAFLFVFFVINVIGSSAILYGIIFYAMRQVARAEEVLEERTHQLEPPASPSPAFSPPQVTICGSRCMRSACLWRSCAAT